jgi:tetratricopeptide (TPR) repeat protein
MEQNNNHFQTRVERLLTELVEEPAPPDLLHKVMRVIETRKQPWHLRLRRWLTRPLPVGISPVWMGAAMALGLILFRLGAMTQPGVRVSDPVVLSEKSPPMEKAEAMTNYRIGRALLEAGQGDRALTFLAQAVSQDPQAAEFRHWQGVAYWLQGDRERERQSYLEAVRYNPDFLPAQLNLAHHYLEGGEVQLALEQYMVVLKNDPAQPSALYNKALAYRHLDQKQQEKQALADFLAQYRTGKWAYRALEHLQDGGDYTYRAYRLGQQQVILDSRALLLGNEHDRTREMRHLSQALNGLSGEELHLVVYRQGNLEEARQTALALREQLRLVTENREVTIRTSWFDVAEQLTDERGRELAQPHSLLIFSKLAQSPAKRNAT